MLKARCVKWPPGDLDFLARAQRDMGWAPRYRKSFVL